MTTISSVSPSSVMVVQGDQRSAKNEGALQPKNVSNCDRQTWLAKQDSDAPNQPSATRGG